MAPRPGAPDNRPVQPENRNAPPDNGRPGQQVPRPPSANQQSEPQPRQYPGTRPENNRPQEPPQTRPDNRRQEAPQMRPSQPSRRRLSGRVCGGSCGRLFSGDRKSTRLNSSHVSISYAVFCLKKKK